MTTPQFRIDRSETAPTHAPVPLLDVNRENSELGEELTSALQAVCASGRFIMGPDCEQLEQHIARYVGAKHAIGCASGSDALLLALMAVDLQPGDEVIVPSFTFFATASAVSRLGGVPVFVDIDPQTFNIAPDQMAAAMTAKTKAIIPVHLFGQSADMTAISEIAHARRIAVIEDAAQAIGSAWKSQPVGSLGAIGCFSFYPTKNLGGFGDGGMLSTNDDHLAQRLRLLRAHGMQPRYYHQEIGINSRLDTLQAAVLNVKLPHLAKWTETRRANAQRYQQWLSSLSGAAEQFTLPQAHPQAHHVWNQYTIRVHAGQRDALRAYLAERRIGSEIYYPVPLHQQACYRHLGKPRHDLQQTERAATEVLSLPIFPHLTLAEQTTVVEAIGEFFSRNSVRPPHTSVRSNSSVSSS